MNILHLQLCYYTFIHATSAQSLTLDGAFASGYNEFRSLIERRMLRLAEPEIQVRSDLKYSVTGSLVICARW